MQSRSFRIVAFAALAASLALAGGTARNAAALPSGNTVQQWDEIAANTVVASGAFGNEGLQYMAYVSAAIYDAVTSIEGGYEPYGPAVAEGMRMVGAQTRKGTRRSCRRHARFSGTTSPARASPASAATGSRPSPTGPPRRTGSPSATRPPRTFSRCVAATVSSRPSARPRRCRRSQSALAYGD